MEGKTDIVLPPQQGNLLRGIDNCLGAVQPVKKPWTKVLLTFYSLFQLKSIKEMTKKVGHDKKITKMQMHVKLSYYSTQKQQF